MSNETNSSGGGGGGEQESFAEATHFGADVCVNCARLEFMRFSMCQLLDRTQLHGGRLTQRSNDMQRAGLVFTYSAKRAAGVRRLIDADHDGEAPGVDAELDGFGTWNAVREQLRFCDEQRAASGEGVVSPHDMPMTSMASIGLISPQRSVKTLDDLVAAQRRASRIVNPPLNIDVAYLDEVNMLLTLGKKGDFCSGRRRKRRVSMPYSKKNADVAEEVRAVCEADDVDEKSELMRDPDVRRLRAFVKAMDRAREQRRTGAIDAKRYDAFHEALLRSIQGTEAERCFLFHMHLPDVKPEAEYAKMLKMTTLLINKYHRQAVIAHRMLTQIVRRFFSTFFKATVESRSRPYCTCAADGKRHADFQQARHCFEETPRGIEMFDVFEAMLAETYAEVVHNGDLAVNGLCADFEEILQTETFNIPPCPSSKSVHNSCLCRCFEMGYTAVESDDDDDDDYDYGSGTESESDDSTLVEDMDAPFESILVEVENSPSASDDDDDERQPLRYYTNKDGDKVEWDPNDESWMENENAKRRRRKVTAKKKKRKKNKKKQQQQQHATNVQREKIKGPRVVVPPELMKRVSMSGCRNEHNVHMERRLYEVLRRLTVFADYCALLAIETAVYSHMALCALQPFASQNGATARFVANLTLIACNLPPLSIEECEKAYDDAVNLSLRDRDMLHISDYVQIRTQMQFLVDCERHLPSTMTYARSLAMPYNHLGALMHRVRDALYSMHCAAVQNTHRGSHSRKRIEPSIYWGLSEHTKQAELRACYQKLAEACVNYIPFTKA